jgi:hypothetical protein
MQVPIWMLPKAIVEQYNLMPLFHNEFVYVEIRRGMYGFHKPVALPTTNSSLFLHHTVTNHAR